MLWVLLLLLAWAAAGTSCTRLCLASVRAAASDDPEASYGRGLTLYEAAFLSGGPARVADLTLVSMARQRRLLLAHTGWATVVDPRGRDEMERSVLGAIGPDGQSRIAPVRTTAAAAESVRALADRLVAAGLAVPDGAGTTVAGAVRQVRAAAAGVVLLASAALLMPPQPVANRALVAIWFSLPLVLTLSCLAIARIEVHPYTRWASPAGQRLLSALTRRADITSDDRTYLTTVAVRGVRAIGEPDLRAAFAHREPPFGDAHRGH
ncbi:TIGR04222 domain-containing membrane protein [Streptomyces fructofermentans]|uniref:Membrane protein n=1 Tax=Streptomyces fructofermentans TaxID=152141 RepID=A0A918K5M7_9ACTN|nr:TIGR04222 domain-containing membrane protein [Streptomyces fructofermentans]GGX51281.1 membrane protein [Streptomyces fructofermentans]